MMRLLLAGGGTGGHLFPAVALAEQLRSEAAASEVLFVGTERGLEARVLPTLGWPLETIDIKGFAGKGLLEKLDVMTMIPKSVRQGKEILKRFAPDVVVGVGGYASAPMVVAARLLRIPVVLHEQNAVPGLTNRILSRWADRVCVSFEEAADAFAGGRTELTGNPLRSGMEECPENGRERPLLLVFGGSRGARAINDAMCDALVGLAAWRGRLDIMHQTGEEDLEKVRECYAAAGWSAAEVLPFIDDMASAYREARLVLCRAGATTVAELTACGRPAILVPYPYAAGDHQTANAQALAAKGAALMLTQDELDGARLATVIDGLLQAPDDLDSMARMARRLGRKGASARIIAVCRDVIAERKAA